MKLVGNRDGNDKIWQKNLNGKRRLFAFMLCIMLIGMTICGCGAKNGKSQKKQNPGVTNKIDPSLTPSVSAAPTAETDRIMDAADIGRIYAEACTNKDVVGTFVSELGLAGYTAVDCENRLNMTCPEPLLRFISAQQSGHQAGAQFIVAWYSGGYSVYVLTTNQGQVHVKQHFFSLKNGVPEQTEFYEYDAEYFAYSGEGYLLAEGRWHLEEQYLLTLSDGVEHLAVRVAPLSEENRQMCAKYIANVGYGVNNLFITNWTETDFADVDFYDLFQLFYEECYGRKCPYGMSEDLSVGAEYRIAAQEFETVVQSHISVSKEELRKRLRYDAKTGEYIYRPRGYREFDYPDIPYPEVVSYTAGADGTVILYVNAVYPGDNTSALFTHKVTVRYSEDRIYYVGNEISGDGEPDIRWHGRRFTEQQWQEVYGTNEEP